MLWVSLNSLCGCGKHSGALVEVCRGPGGGYVGRGNGGGRGGKVCGYNGERRGLLSTDSAAAETFPYAAKHYGETVGVDCPRRGNELEPDERLMEEGTKSLGRVAVW